jgi:hypothetical protein
MLLGGKGEQRGRSYLCQAIFSHGCIRPLPEGQRELGPETDKLTLEVTVLAHNDCDLPV